MQAILCIQHDRRAVELATVYALHMLLALDQVDSVARIHETELHDDTSRDNTRCVCFPDYSGNLFCRT